MKTTSTYEHEWEDDFGETKTTTIYWDVDFEDDLAKGEFPYAEITDWEGDELTDCEWNIVQEILDEEAYQEWKDYEPEFEFEFEW